MKPRFPTRRRNLHLHRIPPSGQTRKSPARRHRDLDPDPPPAVPAESGNGDSLFPDSRRIGNRGLCAQLPVSRFPAKSGIGDSLPDSRPPRFPAKSAGIGESPGGTGIGNLGLWPTDLATSHWQPLLTCVGGRISAFSRVKGDIWPPGSCLVLKWDEYLRFPDFRPNRESGIP
jgi:hypothetical protein